MWILKKTWFGLGLYHSELESTSAAKQSSYYYTSQSFDVFNWILFSRPRMRMGRD